MKILQKFDCENPTKMGRMSAAMSQKYDKIPFFYEIFGRPNDILNSELWEKKLFISIGN